MKPTNASTTPSISTVSVITLLAALAVAAATVGWAPAVALATTNAETTTPSAEKPLVPKQPVTYKSRYYGVSFVYPWQYAFVNAKTIAKSSRSEERRVG